MKRVNVQLSCDLCEAVVPAAFSVELNFDRSRYQVDLCAVHEAAFRDAVEPYVKAAPVIARGRTRHPNAPRRLGP
jgi:hypothetical protein